MIIVIKKIYIEIPENVAYFVFSPYFLQCRFQLYNLFLNLIEFRKASDSHGFLLLYFIFILTFGKYLFSSAISFPWKISKQLWVPVML